MENMENNMEIPENNMEIPENNVEIPENNMEIPPPVNMTGFHHLPIEVRLKILSFLTKREVLQCRAVSLDFLPAKLVVGLILSSSRPNHPEDADWNVVISEYRATVALDLYPVVTSPLALPHFEGGYSTQPEGVLDLRLDFGRIHEGFIVQDRVFQDLGSFPETLLDRTESLLVFGNGVKGQDLDRIVQHCAHLKRLALIETGPEVVEKMTQIQATAGATLTQVGYSDSLQNGNVGVDCGILKKSSGFVWFGVGCGKGTGIEVGAMVNVFPTCLTSLSLHSRIQIPELEALLPKLFLCQKLTLTIKEAKRKRVPAPQNPNQGQVQRQPFQFASHHLHYMTGLPKLTELTLKFHARCGSPYETDLEHRLTPLVSQCRESNGIYAEIGNEEVKWTKYGMGKCIMIRAFIDRPT